MGRNKGSGEKKSTVTVLKRILEITIFCKRRSKREGEFLSQEEDVTQERTHRFTYSGEKKLKFSARCLIGSFWLRGEADGVMEWKELLLSFLL